MDRGSDSNLNSNRIRYIHLRGCDLGVGQLFNSKPSWRGLGLVRLSCPGKTTSTAAALHVVPIRPDGSRDSRSIEWYIMISVNKYLKMVSALNLCIVNKRYRIEEFNLLIFQTLKFEDVTPSKYKKKKN